MFGPSLQVAKLFGIPIRLHISLLLLLLLPFLLVDFDWLPALIFSVALFSSIVLHELGHSLVAIRQGGRVREILLMPIGGAARLERMSSKPMDELLMALAGPAVSLVVFLVLFFGGALLPLTREAMPAGGVSLRINRVQVLGLLNLMLGLFNLLPAFPMDGGRVLRALLAHRYGRLKATGVAARVGQVIASGLALMAVVEWIAGTSFSMLFFVALFIFWAAGAEYRTVRLQEWQKLQGWSGWPSWSDESPHEHVTVSPPPCQHGSTEDLPVTPVRRSPFKGS